MVCYCYLDTPLGRMLLVQRGERLTQAEFDALPPREGTEQVTPLLARAKSQLTQYFQGRRKAFSLPLAPQGTPFQQRVWKALGEIPYGQTRSYGEIARQVGSPRGARAVGMANHRNPIAVLIPCHRVVGQKGKLVGYAGGLWRKEKLLALESEGQKDLSSQE